MGIRNAVKKPLEGYWKREYRKELSTRRMTYREYLDGICPDRLETLPEDNKITNDILFLTCKRGELSAEASQQVETVFAKHPQTILVYGDEDVKAPDGSLSKPWFKPQWSPDRFLSSFYFGSFVAVRISALKECGMEIPSGQVLKPEELYRLCLVLLKKKGGFTRTVEGKEAIRHLPYILFHKSEEKQECAGTDEYPHFEDLTEREKLWQDGQTGKLSVIIPSKDHPELLRTCISSLRRTVRKTAIKTAVEIIVVDNGSSEKNRSLAEELAKELDFEYLYEPMPFHFSKMCNLGARKAIGEQLLFLNDDIECTQEGWLEQLLAVSSRNHVGAVGCKLLYPEGERIQHTGVTNLPIGPVHKLQFLPDNGDYYDSFHRGVRNVLAVTGACLLVKKQLFDEAGGFSEELAVAFNDIDLCFTLYELGYYNVVVNEAVLLHHESASRGDDESEEKWQRLMRERDSLYRRHPGMEGKDPFYSIHLNRSGLDTRVVPAYQQGKNKPQILTPTPIKPLAANTREDKCLLLRMEQCRSKTTQEGDAYAELYGYGVVLGSDNALFQRKLLLRSANGKLWQLPVERQYRSDLEENMPDQIHVALSGFLVRIPEKSLPEGSYEIGMCAKDRTGGTRLLSWSGRRIYIRKIRER